MKLSEFFEKAGTKDIVINTDIDGFLSGILLQEYYGCKVVGFSNSREYIWLSPEVENILDPVYLDIFINRKDAYCIDQHVVAYDKNHLNEIKSWGTKLNPNLDLSERTYSGDLGTKANYYKKYPFGTVHYLISLMAEDGFGNVSMDLDKVFTISASTKTYSATKGQFILRADDALFSSLGPYRENANAWWSLLNTSDNIQSLIDYKNSLDSAKNYSYKKEIGQLFTDGLGCDGIDGAFKTILKPGTDQLADRITAYSSFLADVTGVRLDLPEKYVTYKGTPKICKYDDDQLKQAFTYAFITSPSKPKSAFSYTSNMVRI
ncbi:MAG: hypothetical protein K5773_03665 [Pseudobutyrivibrio sp.]|nr:hypothetical protein [Pseudobutyrivibrio sp.]